ARGYRALQARAAVRGRCTNTVQRLTNGWRLASRGATVRGDAERRAALRPRGAGGAVGVTRRTGIDGGAAVGRCDVNLASRPQIAPQTLGPCAAPGVAGARGGRGSPRPARRGGAAVPDP